MLLNCHNHDFAMFFFNRQGIDAFFNTSVVPGLVIFPIADSAMQNFVLFPTVITNTLSQVIHAIFLIHRSLDYV